MNEFRSKLFGGNDGEASPLVPVKRPSGASAEQGLRTVAVQRLESRSGNTRDGDRHRLPDEAVKVSHDGDVHDVQLINLSGGGAMISADFEPMLWERVDLHLMEGRTVQCIVQWIRDDRIGLEFAHETHIDCPPEERNALLREVIARSFPEAAAECVQAPAADDRSASTEPGAEPQRAESRHPLIWSGVIHFNHDSTPVRLRNISSQGALIECQGAVPEGAELLLDLGEAGSLFASVSWAIGDQVGLNFKEPFDVQLLARSRPEVAPVNWEAPDYLSGKNISRSPLADPWRRLSVTDLAGELDGFLKR